MSVKDEKFILEGEIHLPQSPFKEMIRRDKISEKENLKCQFMNFSVMNVSQRAKYLSASASDQAM